MCAAWCVFRSSRTPRGESLICVRYIFRLRSHCWLPVRSCYCMKPFPFSPHHGLLPTIHTVYPLRIVFSTIYSEYNTIICAFIEDTPCLMRVSAFVSRACLVVQSRHVAGCLREEVLPVDGVSAILHASEEVTVHDGKTKRQQKHNRFFLSRALELYIDILRSIIRSSLIIQCHRNSDAVILLLYVPFPRSLRRGRG